MEEMTFEQAMKRLNEITDIISNGQCSLDDGLKLFEEGMKLSKYCSDMLKSYQDKLNELTENLSENND